MDEGLGRAEEIQKIKVEEWRNDQSCALFSFRQPEDPRHSVPLEGPQSRTRAQNISWNRVLSQGISKYLELLSKPRARKPKLQIPCCVPGPGLGPAAPGVGALSMKQSASCGGSTGQAFPSHQELLLLAAQLSHASHFTGHP